MRFEPNRKSLKELYFEPKYGYSIPQYQRPYSWKKENFEGFWELIKNGEEKFLGTVIYNIHDFKSSDRKEIIDGQQRYLTITILGASMRDAFLEDYKRTENTNALQRAEDSHEEIIGRRNRETNNYENYLLAGASSKDYFEANIQRWDKIFISNTEGSIELQKPITDEHKLIAQAYYFFKSKIFDEIESKGLEETYKTVLKNLGNLFVISIEIDDYSMAFEIFESVNGQGVDLSVSDLIKNQIFKNVERQDLISAEKKWNEITENLENSGLNLSPQEFLRYFWASKFDYVPDAKLYTAITREFKDKGSNSWLQLLDDMHADSELLSDNINFSVDQWKNYLGNRNEAIIIYKSLRAIRTVKGKTWVVLLLSILRKLNEIRGEGIKISTHIEKIQEFSFFYFGIMGLPSNWYWIQMHTTARAIHRAKEKQNYNTIFEKLYKEFATKFNLISKEGFKDQFEKIQYNPNNLPIIYYVLGEIESKLHPETSSGWDSDKVNIEHFIPQEPKEWGLSKTQIRTKVNYIGNLLLISQKLNGKLGNKTCEKKLELIKDSQPDMQLLKDLVLKIENGEWPFDKISSHEYEFFNISIDKRQDFMAEIAYSIWVEGLRKKLGY